MLVTGGEGFIGSHLVEELLAAAARRCARSRTTTPFGRWGWLDDRRRARRRDHAGDVRDAERVRRRVEGCDVVFHLAALIGIPYSYEAPESYVQTNVTGHATTVANGAPRRRPRYVHTSTSEVYGTRAARADRRGAPAAAAVAVLGVEDRRRHDGADVPPRLRAARRGRAAVQHLRPAPVGPRGDPADPRPAARRAPTRSGSARPRPTRDFNYVTDTAAGFMASPQCDRALGRGRQRRLRAGRSRSATSSTHAHRDQRASTRRSWSTSPSASARRAARSTACCATTAARGVGRLAARGVPRGGPAPHGAVDRGEPHLGADAALPGLIRRGARR